MDDKAKFELTKQVAQAWHGYEDFKLGMERKFWWAYDPAGETKTPIPITNYASDLGAATYLLSQVCDKYEIDADITYVPVGEETETMNANEFAWYVSIGYKGNSKGNDLAVVICEAALAEIEKQRDGVKRSVVVTSEAKQRLIDEHGLAEEHFKIENTPSADSGSVRDE
jgi:hypothetical protein